VLAEGPAAPAEELWAEIKAGKGRRMGRRAQRAQVFRSGLIRSGSRTAY